MNIILKKQIKVGYMREKSICVRVDRITNSSRIQSAKSIIIK